MAFDQLARRTVVEAWLAGDALLRTKEQLPHGAWPQALREPGIAPTTILRRSFQLPKKYSSNRPNCVRFGNVSAALD